MHRFAAAMLAVLLCGAALAQPYPSKPVRIIIPFPPGGGAEGAARLIASHLGLALGQPFVVEPRPGGNTVIGAEAAAKAPADGHTLFMSGGSTMSIQPFVFPGKLPYEPLADFAPISIVSRLPFFLFVSAERTVATFRDLVALAKARPGELSYATNGNGSTAHVGFEILLQGFGLRAVHVPYKGFAPALPDVLGGRVTMMMADIAPIGEHVRAGKLRVLAVTSLQRSSFMPEIPSVAELGLPGYELEVWFALYAPAKTPPEIVTLLNAELRKYLSSAEAKAAYARLGHDAEPSTPEAVRAKIISEQKQFSAAVKAAKIAP